MYFKEVNMITRSGMRYNVAQVPAQVPAPVPAPVLVTPVNAPIRNTNTPVVKASRQTGIVAMQPRSLFSQDTVVLPAVSSDNSILNRSRNSTAGIFIAAALSSVQSVAIRVFNSISSSLSR